MGTRYRVIVEQIVDVEDAQYKTTDTILFETVSPSALALLRYAPIEVEAAIREAAGVAEAEQFPQRVVLGVDAAAGGSLVATVFDRNGAVIGAVGEGDSTVVVPPSAVEPVAEPVDDKPKRKRRTKAEIDADKAAADAAARATEQRDGAGAPEAAAGPQWPSAAEVEANHKALNTVDAPEPVVDEQPPAYTPFGNPAPVPTHTPAPVGQGVTEQTGQFANPFLGK